MIDEKLFGTGNSVPHIHPDLFFFYKRQQPYLGFNLTLLLEKKIFLLRNIFKKLGKIGKLS